MKNKIISILMLVLFGLPGICSEGLHTLLPFGIGMIYHQNVDLGDSDPDSGGPVPSPLKYNPNCPICQFCAQARTDQVIVPILTACELMEKLVETAVENPFFYNISVRFLRGPPLLLDLFLA